MKKIKNEAGMASIILIFILLILIIFIVCFSLEFLGIVELPEKYSLTKWMNSILGNSYSLNRGEKIDTDSKNRNTKKIKKTNKEYDDNSIIEVTGNLTGYYNYSSESACNDYYYLQLDDNGKRIYDGIIENIDNIKSGTYEIQYGKDFNDLLNEEGGDEILNNCFQSAVNAVLLDNPEVFYLDITKMYLLTKSTTYPFVGTTYEVSIGCVDNESYLAKGFSRDNLKSSISTLKNIKNEIARNVSGSTEEQIKEVHDYLIDNLEYDSTLSNDNIYNVYGALVNNYTVCEGYAKAFKLIMDELDIPCIVVCGSAENSKGEIENHAWNYVMIDKEWYGIDVTWDDPIIIGNGTLSRESKYKYFLKGSDFLFKDHEEDGSVVDGANFEYPNLSQTDY